MKIQAEMQNDIAVVTVGGELNADSVNKFQETVQQIRDRGARDFVVDLSAITQVDSAGLEALSALQQQCEEQLGMVRFCGADPMLQKIFEITRLDKRFLLEDRIDDALASFA